MVKLKCANWRVDSKQKQHVAVAVGFQTNRQLHIGQANGFAITKSQHMSWTDVNNLSLAQTPTSLALAVETHAEVAEERRPPHATGCAPALCRRRRHNLATDYTSRPPSHWTRRWPLTIQRQRCPQQTPDLDSEVTTPAFLAPIW